ncbi:unnamed protein product [Closterium sp. Yama58-4]|nr:unnamed protein product [Closterium sp. Yama58-4]
MDDLYRESLEEDPGNALFLRNYAQFLYEVKGDYFAADAVFQKATEAAPTDGELLVLYAKFLWEGMCDAEKLHRCFSRQLKCLLTTAMSSQPMRLSSGMQTAC